MLQAVVFQHEIGDRFERAWIATIDFEYSQSVRHAFEMFGALEQFAPIDANDVINAVRKKKASVVRGDCDF